MPDEALRSVTYQDLDQEGSFVVAYQANPQQAGSDENHTISNLPPGNYLVSATTIECFAESKVSIRKNGSAVNLTLSLKKREYLTTSVPCRLFLDGVPAANVDLAWEVRWLDGLVQSSLNTTDSEGHFSLRISDILPGCLAKIRVVGYQDGVRSLARSLEPELEFHLQKRTGGPWIKLCSNSGAPIPNSKVWFPAENMDDLEWRVTNKEGMFSMHGIPEARWGEINANYLTYKNFMFEETSKTIPILLDEGLAKIEICAGDGIVINPQGRTGYQIKLLTIYKRSTHSSPHYSAIALQWGTIPIYVTGFPTIGTLQVYIIGRGIEPLGSYAEVDLANPPLWIDLMVAPPDFVNDCFVIERDGSPASQIAASRFGIFQLSKQGLFYNHDFHTLLSSHHVIKLSPGYFRFIDYDFFPGKLKVASSSGWAVLPRRSKINELRLSSNGDSISGKTELPPLNGTLEVKVYDDSGKLYQARVGKNGMFCVPVPDDVKLRAFSILLPSGEVLRVENPNRQVYYDKW